MDCNVEKTCVDVQDSQIVTNFSDWHEIRKAEEIVGQHEYGSFIECFHVVRKVGLVRLVPLNVNHHADRYKSLDGKLHPHFPQNQRRDYKDYSAHKEHRWHD